MCGMKLVKSSEGPSDPNDHSLLPLVLGTHLPSYLGIKRFARGRKYAYLTSLITILYINGPNSLILTNPNLMAS